MILHPDETISELGIRNFKIIQKKNGFRFGIDAVLVAHFAQPKKGDVGVDLGTGNGIIPTIILAKSEVGKIIGVDIQKDAIELARRNALTNGLSEQFEPVEGDITLIESFLPRSCFDFVVANPPYYKCDTLTSPNIQRSIARHEVKVQLDDILNAASYLLRPNKSFYMIHKPERLVEIFTSARAVSLEPKELQFIHPNTKKAPNLVLIRMVKGGKTGLKYREPLFVYNSPGSYSDQILEIYNAERIGG